MLIVGRVLTRLGGQVANTLGQITVVRHQHATAARRDDLVAIEGEGGTGPERTRAAIVIRRTERFGGIFNNRHTAPTAHGFDAVVVRTLAIQVYGDNCRDARAAPGTPSELLVQQVGDDDPAVPVS